MSGIFDVMSEVAMTGLEGMEKVGHLIGAPATKLMGSLPFVGSAINGGKAILDGNEGHKAALAGDTDRADVYNNKSAYDWLKAIPGVGMAFGAGELVNGAITAVRGDGSFHEGMERFGDTVQDLGSMAGIKEFQHTSKDGLGTHTEQRHLVEEREKMAKVAQPGGV